MRACKGAAAPLPQRTRNKSYSHRAHSSTQQSLRRFSRKCSCHSNFQISCRAPGIGCSTSMHRSPANSIHSSCHCSPTQASNIPVMLSTALPLLRRSPLLQATAAAATATGSSSDNAPRAVIVGAGPTGLAAAIGLANQAGFSVDVFDSRPYPPDDAQAAREALLVALGARGLLALCDLDISLSPTQSHTSQQSEVPGEKIEGRPVTPSLSHTASPITNLVGGLKPPTGLTLLQGMVLQGPAGSTRVEQYARPKQQDPKGIAVIDSYTLITSLLSEATAASTSTRAAAASATHLPLALTADTYSSAAFDVSAAAAAATRQETTPLASGGAAAAASAEEAQAGTVPAVILTPGTPGADLIPGSQTSTSGRTPESQSLTGQNKSGGGGVRCHYGCELLMVDTANRQTTFIGPDGAARVVAFDLLIGAEHEAGALLVAEALAEIHQRESAHKHSGSSSSSGRSDSQPAASAANKPLADAAAAQGDIKQQQQHPDRLAALPAAAQAAAKAAGFVELEFKSWRDMPHQKELSSLLPHGLGDLHNSMDEVGHHHQQQQGPAQGWLLVWTGASGTGKAAPFPSTGDTETTSDTATWTVSGTSGDTKRSSGSGSVLMPGSPGCTLMAWVSRGGGSWSGAVFTAPQVFESLRSQADYEGMLKGLRSSSGGVLPGIWIKGIASQLKGKGDRVGRVMAPFLLPPPHLAAPAAGLALLSPSASLTGNPQLLCPTVSLGFEDASLLAAAVAGAVGKQGGTGQLQQRVEQALRHYDRRRQPQMAALQKLQAQLSYLRHPFSPAAAAALAMIPPLSLPWFTGLFARTRAGLALQWQSLIAVLPLLAAVTSALKSLGFGRRTPAAAKSSTNRVHSSGSSNTTASGVSTPSAASGVAATAAAAGMGLAEVLDAVQPSGASLLAYLHTTAVPYTTLWNLLHAAPLLLAAVWAVGIWAAAEAVRWGVWAWRVWGVSWAGA